MPMAFLDHAKDLLHVIVERDDLGYAPDKSGKGLALRSFLALCESWEELRYPYSLWHFTLDSHRIVERILNQRGRTLTIVSKSIYPDVVSYLRPVKNDTRGEGQEETPPTRGRLIEFPRLPDGG